MRRLPIYRRGTDSEVRASERSPFWQGMGHSLLYQYRHRHETVVSKTRQGARLPLALDRWMDWPNLIR